MCEAYPVVRKKGRPLGGKIPLLPAVSDMDASYAAGLFDGEGSVCIVLQTTRAKKYHKIMVGMSMTDQRILEWLATMFGGHVYPRHKTPEGCKQAWEWRLSATRAEWFLQQIQPYSKIKQIPIALGLELQSMKVYRGRPRVDMEEQRLEDFAKREVVRQQLLAHNKRGAPSSPPVDDAVLPISA